MNFVLQYKTLISLVAIFKLFNIVEAQRDNSSLYKIHYTSPDAIISYYHFEFEDIPHPSIYTQKLKDIKFTRINAYFLTNYHKNIEGKIYHLVDIFGNDDICDEIPYIPYLVPNTTWIALISQSQKCSINHQIDIIANKAKASALIIYKHSNSLVDWFISEYPGPPFSSVVVSLPPAPPAPDSLDHHDHEREEAEARRTNMTVVYLPADRAGYLTRHVDTLSERYNLTLRVNISSSPYQALEVGADMPSSIPTHRNNRVRVGLSVGGAGGVGGGGIGGGGGATFVSRTSIMFVSISFIVLMIISLAWLVFYYVQRFRYAHAKDQLAKRLNSAAKKALVKIPLRTVKVDDKVTAPDSDACAVCIESFRPNEIIRELKCGHTFHKMCVDTWLLLQRSCPICKLDILEAYGLTIDKSRRAFKTCASALRSHDHHHHVTTIGSNHPPGSNVTALIFGGGGAGRLHPSALSRGGRRPLSLTTPTGGSGLHRDWYYAGRADPPQPTSSPHAEYSDSTSGGAELDRILMGGIIGEGDSSHHHHPRVTYVVHSTSPMPLPLSAYGEDVRILPHAPSVPPLPHHPSSSSCRKCSSTPSLLPPYPSPPSTSPPSPPNSVGPAPQIIGAQRHVFVLPPFLTASSPPTPTPAKEGGPEGLADDI